MIRIIVAVSVAVSTSQMCRCAAFACGREARVGACDEDDAAVGGSGIQALRRSGSSADASFFELGPSELLSSEQP